MIDPVSYLVGFPFNEAGIGVMEETENRRHPQVEGRGKENYLTDQTSGGLSAYILRIVAAPNRNNAAIGNIIIIYGQFAIASLTLGIP